MIGNGHRRPLLRELTGVTVPAPFYAQLEVIYRNTVAQMIAQQRPVPTWSDFLYSLMVHALKTGTQAVPGREAPAAEEAALIEAPSEPT